MKITKSFLQKLIQEEVRKILREEDITDPSRVGALDQVEGDPSLPGRQKLDMKAVLRIITNPEFLQGVGKLAIGRGPRPELYPPQSKFNQDASLLRIMVRDHPNGLAGGMEALNSALVQAGENGALKDNMSQASTEELQRAIKSIVAPDDTGVESPGERSLNFSTRGQAATQAAQGAEQLVSDPGSLNESRDVSRALKWRRGVHPVAQRKTRRRR